MTNRASSARKMAPFATRIGLNDPNLPDQKSVEYVTATAPAQGDCIHQYRFLSQSRTLDDKT